MRTLVRIPVTHVKHGSQSCTPITVILLFVMKECWEVGQEDAGDLPVAGTLV